ARLDPVPVDGGGPGPAGVAGPDLLGGRLRRGGGPLTIDLEAEGIGALEVEIVLLPAPRIEHRPHARAGRHPEVVPAGPADPQVLGELGVVQRGCTPLALRPNPLGDGLFRLGLETTGAGPPRHGRPMYRNPLRLARRKGSTDCRDAG